MAVFDLLAVSDGDDEYEAWLSKVIDSRDEIIAFAAGHLGSTTGEFNGYLYGSFNLCICIKFNDGRSNAIIRFPKPGLIATAFRDEKVANEVQFMKFLSQNTTIPLPHVFCWGLTEESPRQLGPFIIMEYVNGTLLSDILKQPITKDQKDEVLNPDIDDAILRTVYYQIADYMVQLSQLDFTNIGAISQDPSSQDPSSKIWFVSRRPLTYNMNELATVVSGYPIDQFPPAQFSSASEYFRNLANLQLIHLQTQRNLSKDPEDVMKRFIARYRYKQLIPKYCIEDAGPFKPYCDDLRPSNILVDPRTLRVTSVLDLEFTNIMPAQFAYDPPWWLLLQRPCLWYERGKMEEFMVRYPPIMEQFVQAVERVEASRGIQPDATSLSTRMRDSWNTGRFWFNYGIRVSFGMDDIYWATLYKDGAELLDEETHAEAESLVQMKMEQLKAYEKELAAVFSKKKV